MLLLLIWDFLLTFDYFQNQKLLIFYQIILDLIVILKMIMIMFIRIIMVNSFYLIIFL